MSFHLRNKILIPLTLVFLWVASIFVAIYQNEQQQKLSALKQLTMASVEAYHKANIAARTKKLEVLTDEIISNPMVVQYLKTDNRSALLALLHERYRVYDKAGHITRFSFLTPTGVSLLRLHQPDRHGDLIERATLKRAMNIESVAAGVELDTLGTLFLRVVQPVVDSGEVVGYVELGEEIGDIYNDVISTFGVDLYLLIDEGLLVSGDLTAFPGATVVRGTIPDTVIYQFNNETFPVYLLKALSVSQGHRDTHVHASHQDTHLFGVLPLTDVRGRSLGRVVIIKDVTDLIVISTHSMILIGTITILIWGLVSLFLYDVLGRFERRLNRSIEALYGKEVSLVNAQHLARLSGWELNLTTQTFNCSAEFCLLLEIDPAQAPTTLDALIVYVHPDERQIFKEYINTVIDEQGGEDLLHRLVTANGVEVWVSLVAARICTVDHRCETVQAVVQDITEARGAELQAAKLGSLLKYSWNEIYLFHGETLAFVEVSEGALRNLGYSLAEMKNKTPLDIASGVSAHEFDETVTRLRNGLIEQMVFESVHQRKDGSHYPVEVRLQYCRDVTPALFMAIIQDITERQRYTAELERKVLYDEQTGLPNRALLCDRLGQWIKQSARNEGVFAVLVLEVNRIKEIDDVLGYDVGDALIKQVAVRVVSGLRQSDVVGHLGGGIFVLLLPLQDEEKVHPLIDKLLLLSQVPIDVGDISIDIDISVGAALYPAHGDEPSLLMRRADMALQHAKAELLNQMVYQDTNHPFSIRRLQLIADLRQAIKNEQLVVHYQPKVNSATGVVESVEALVRWPLGNESQWVGPAEFIPLAEQTGLIYPLTELVLRQAVKQCHHWLEVGIDINVAINLSARNLLDPSLSNTIRNVMADNQVPAKNITLEVTEGMMMRQPERALGILNQLHDQGLGVSIDDYGTGYSSLAYLRQLPVHELKIDQSFIRTMLNNKDDATIVRSTIELAHNLGLRVVAEGVEDMATWVALRELGCDLIQGYFVSRPANAVHFEAWYRNHGGRFIPE